MPASRARRPVGVVFAVLMPLRAVSGENTESSHVLYVGYGFQMPWVDTPCLQTQVVNFQTFWDLPSEELV